MCSTDFIKNEYPLHWLVWNNEHNELDKVLSTNADDKEKRDVRGRTPLMLAVTLGHLESARTLMQHEANVNTENREGWTVLQEAVATGDPELLQLVVERRDYQRYTNRIGGIPGLLQKLKEAPDFYVEMKWEFTSWVPLVSGLCPSDTYKVYKQGSNVRIDTTLLGFDQNKWLRGNKSYIFKGQNSSAVFMEVDHETQQVIVEQMRMLCHEDLQFLKTHKQSISTRLSSPIVALYVDTDQISFERNKSGIWGWRSDKHELVNGHECKVFGASNVAFVTKTRTEHLTESQKASAAETSINSLLSPTQIEEAPASNAIQGETSRETYTHIGNPCSITAEEYFDEQVDLKGRDIGRPKEIDTKIQKFKATLWLCENYPLTLPEQIMPIVDLMAISSSHFKKLKDFIQMQLPAGFPVKIEIPLFHVLNARITFGNIFGLDEEIGGIARVEDENGTNCIVDDNCFEPPASYVKLGAEVRRQYSVEEDDELLQFAIQQSLIEAGSEKDEVDIWEALRGQRPSRPVTPDIHSEEERQLQRAIQASLALYQHTADDSSPEIGSSSLRLSPDGQETPSPDSPLMTDRDLQLALKLSQRDREEEEERRRQEEEMLQQVLQLSLTEK